MARRKHDADVGPLGVWAYNTRDALDLSVEAVVAALPTHYHPATLRKVEGGSAQPGTRMWRELGNYYTNEAERRNVPIDSQPRLGPESVTPEDLSLAAAIRELVAELRESRKERAAVEARLAVLEPVVKRLAAQALEDSPARSVPQESGG